MKITHEDQRELTVLTLKGELSKDQADRFRRSAIERMDARVRDFVLNCADLESLDSQGIEALLWLQDQCDERLGQVRLAGCTRHIDNILKITRLDGRFQRHADVPTAIRSLG